MLSACSPTGRTYAQAVTQTWQPFRADTADRTALLREFVRYATLAPSSHNTQCWRFGIEPDRIIIHPDFTRRCPVVDPDDHHLFVSLGCATENLVQAASAHGMHGSVSFERAPVEGISVALESARPVTSELFTAIPQRQSTRSAYDGTPVAIADLHALQSAGTGNGVRVELVTARPQIERILTFVVDGNTAELTDPAFMTELKQWIRFNDAEAVAAGDGLLSRASGGPSLPRWLGSSLLGIVLKPKSDGDRYAALIRSSAGVAVFISEVNDREHWVEAGRCYERFALQAAARNIRTAMLNQPVEVAAVRARFAAALGLGHARPDLIVRFGYGPPAPRSLRRPVAAVLNEGGSS